MVAVDLLSLADVVLYLVYDSVDRVGWTRRGRDSLMQNFLIPVSLVLIATRYMPDRPHTININRRIGRNTGQVAMGDGLFVAVFSISE